MNLRDRRIRTVRPKSLGIISLILCALAACNEASFDTHPVAINNAATNANSPQLDPIWSEVTDAEMWERITQADTQVTVGIKRPGASTALDRGQPTASREQWIDAITHLRSNPQWRLVSADSVHLPIARLRPRTVAALGALRKLSFIDFVEPANITYTFASGCGSSGYTGGRMAALQGSNGGWDTVAAVYRGMNIPNMWKISAGQGVEVGLIDTGVDPGTPGSEYEKALWWTPQGRNLSRRNAQIFPYDTVPETTLVPPCNHGTRMAGIAVAPNNGKNVVGIAHRAGLISVEVNDQVWYAADAERTALGVHRVAEDGYAKVVIMAFGGSPSNDLAFEIQKHFYDDDIVFVGAAGTGTQIGCCSVFPASMSEVLAVTGAAHNGFRPGDVYEVGSKYPAAAATTFLLTTQNGNPGTVEIAGSSGATAVLGGLAAAIRSRNPSFTANQVYERIVRTSGDDCGAPWAWYPLINASAAVGGPCVTYIRHGALVFYANQTSSFTTSAVIRFADGYFLGGSGNYSAQWTTTGGAILNGGPINGPSTDTDGNLVWQTAQNFRFEPAWDGQPYNVVITARVTDNVLGTVDTRTTDTLRVCSSPSACYATNRLYPPPPPPPSLTISIYGPSNVAQNGSNTWTAGVGGASGSYSIRWEVSYDEEQSWSYLGSGSSYTKMFSNEGPYSMVLRATVTASRKTAQATHPVYVDTFCGGEIC